MKKRIYVGCMAILIAIGIWIGIKTEVHPVLAQPVGGQNYYTYHSLNTTDATGGVTVWSTGINERFTIHGMFINGPVAMEVQLLDGSTEITTYYYAADGGAVPIFDLRSVAKGNDLTIKSNAAGQISVLVTGESLWY